MYDLFINQSGNLFGDLGLSSVSRTAWKRQGYLVIGVVVGSQDPKVGIERFNVKQRVVRYGSDVKCTDKRDFTLAAAGVESTLSHLLEMHTLAETL